MRARKPTRKSHTTTLAAPLVPVEQDPVNEDVPAWVAGLRKRSFVQASMTTVTRLLHDIEHGGYRKPRFQRPYVWSDEQVLLLLDSLLRGVHVGTLLMWEMPTKGPTVETWGPLTVTVGRGGKWAARAVVDGQQRMTALVTVAHDPRFVFDLDTGTFLLGEEGGSRVRFGRILNGGEAFYELMDFLRRELKNEAWSTAAFALMDAVRNWELATVVLSADVPREQVVDTFVRMNTTGTTVSAEDLDRALWLAEEE